MKVGFTWEDYKYLSWLWTLYLGHYAACGMPFSQLKASDKTDCRLAV